jgi:ComF family protein
VTSARSARPPCVNNFEGPLGVLLDALYPPRCLVCSRTLDSVRPSVCSQHALPALGVSCPRCAQPLSPHLARAVLCPECRQRPRRFSRTLALGEYGAQGPLRDWVLQLKHGGRPDLAAPLGAALAQRLAEEPEEWRAGARLVPVPLHPLRRLERGHDQAALLAQALSETSSLPLVRALRRTRYAPPQGSLGSRSRQANVRAGFRLRRAARQLEGRTVWLVDDVLTSGATASECARLLRRAGAERVGLLVVARAGPAGARADLGTRAQA